MSGSAAPALHQAAGGAPGPLRRLLGRMHVHGVFWYRFHCWGARALPQAVFPVLALVCSAIGFCLLPKVRRNVASNLEAVLGPCGFWERQRRVWRNIRVFAWCLHERYESLGAGFEIKAEVENIELWRALDAREEGYLLVTAHLGHWEAAAAKPGKEGKSRHVHVVRDVEISPAAHTFFADLLARPESGLGNHTIHFARPDGSLGPQLLFALRRGDVVALQGDRPAKGGRVVAVELFGRPFEIPVGPLVLARTAEVALLPIFTYRVGRRRALLVFHDPIRIARTDDRDADLQSAAQALTAVIEQAIRRDPYQWFCFKPLWPAAGEP